MPTFDLSATPLRDFNAALHAVAAGDNDTAFEVVNPRGSHALAVGIDKPLRVDVRGSVGYYCAGMNDGGTVIVCWSQTCGRGFGSKTGRSPVSGRSTVFGCGSR